MTQGKSEGGYALVETLVAAALIVSLAAGVAQLLALSVRAVASGARMTTAIVAATQRLEQLSGLVFTYDSLDRAVTDTDTNLAVEPTQFDGRGLRPTGPLTTTARPTAVDYLDATGRWVGAGPRIPRGAVFARRWSVASGGAGLPGLLVMEVVVVTLAGGPTVNWTAVRPGRPGVAWLVTARVRH